MSRRDDETRARELTTSMRAMLDRADAAGRDLSSAEEYEFDQMELELRRLNPSASLNQTIHTSSQTYRFGDQDPGSFAEWRSGHQDQAPQDTPEYRSSFYTWLTTADQRELAAEEYRSLSKGTGAAGAYLVPTDFDRQIVRAERHQGALGQLARTINTSAGETLQVPANTAHGVATWTAENAAYTPSDETFAQVELGANKAATKIIVSEELLADSAFPLDSYLATEFGERIGTLAEAAYILGDGSGKPQGILASDATANITLHTAGVGNATSFTYSALVTAIFALAPQYRQNASFIVNDTSARNLYLMTDDENRPLWNVNVSGSGPATFLGYPIHTHPNLPAPAASKISLVFGDWSKAYTIRRVNGTYLQRQDELHSDAGQVGWRAYSRLDGRVILPTAGIAVKHSAS